QTGMDDLLAHLRRHLPRHRRVTECHHRLELAAERLLVELERRLARAIEGQIPIEIHAVLPCVHGGGAEMKSSSLPSRSFVLTVLIFPDCDRTISCAVASSPWLAPRADSRRGGRSSAPRSGDNARASRRHPSARAARSGTVATAPRGCARSGRPAPAP